MIRHQTIQVDEITYRGRDVEIFLADSVSELTNAALEASKSHPSPMKITITNYDFYGRSFNNPDELKDAVGSVWQEGMSIVNSMLRSLNNVKIPILKSRKRRSRWDEEEGDDIDLDKMRSGQAYWKRTQRESTKGQNTITIISETSAQCRIDSHDILWRGAASIILTYLFEQAGYRVELWCARAGVNVYTDNSSMCAGARIKAHRDPLNMSTAIGAVSSWYHRGVGFLAANLCKKRSPKYNAGRMAPTSPFLKLISNDEHTFIVHSVWSRDSAINLIKSAAATIEAEKIEAAEWYFPQVDAPNPRIIIPMTILGEK